MDKPTLLLVATLALAACGPREDPQAAAAAQARAEAQAAEEMARAFEAEYAKGNWQLARAHGDILFSKHPGSAAAARIEAPYREAKGKAERAREEQRLAALWTYQTQPLPRGQQVTASLYAKERVDVDGSGPRPVQLIFRDHPEWGRSSYLVLEAGDFDCYGGCKVKVSVDGAAPKRMDASRPRTDQAIAMFVEDERALWWLAKAAQTVAIEFPVEAGGTRTAVFEVGGLDPARMPAAWNRGRSTPP